MRKAAGFTLVEVLITIAISGIVVLALYTILTNAVRGVKTAETGHDLVALFDEARDILQNQDMCSTKLSSLHNKNGEHVVLSDVIQSNSTYRDITIQRVTLENIISLREDPSPPMFRADVILEGTKPDGVLGTKFFRKANPVFYYIGNDGLIVGCVPNDWDPKTVCVGLGARWDSENSKCDLCVAFGGLQANGKCYIESNGLPECPHNKIFHSSSNESNKAICGTHWESPYFEQAMQYASNFSQITEEDIILAKGDYQKALLQAQMAKADIPIGGMSGKLKWVIKFEPGNASNGNICQGSIDLKVECP